MEKFLIEEEEAMGERHLLIFVEVDTKEVVRMETYYFEQQVSATLKQLQREAKRAEAKEEEKIEKADTDAGKETEDDESEKEPEAKPERGRCRGRCGGCSGRGRSYSLEHFKGPVQCHAHLFLCQLVRCEP